MDDGGDLVETSYLMAGLLCRAAVFRSGAAARRKSGLRPAIDRLWRGGGVGLAHRAAATCSIGIGARVTAGRWTTTVRGWNECLITYVLAAASPALRDLARGLSSRLVCEGRDLPQRARATHGVGCRSAPTMADRSSSRTIRSCVSIPAV